MIGFLRGIVATKVAKQQICIVCLDVQGIGYEVFTTANTANLLIENGESVQVFTHQIVREDQMLLFGFTQLINHEGLL
jgi:Holliday junction DNA helicase RuvA